MNQLDRHRLRSRHPRQPAPTRCRWHRPPPPASSRRDRSRRRLRRRAGTAGPMAAVNGKTTPTPPRTPARAAGTSAPTAAAAPTGLEDEVRPYVNVAKQSHLSADRKNPPLLLRCARNDVTASYCERKRSNPCTPRLIDSIILVSAILDRFAPARTMTADAVSLSRGAMRPEFCISFALLEDKRA